MVVPTTTDPSQQDELLASAKQVLENNHLCSIATVNRDCTSHINTAYFSFTDISTLYFLSDPASLHCRNISDRPTVALTVFDSRQSWGEDLLGLQLFGDAALVVGAALSTAEQSYSTRFHSYDTWIKSLTQNERADLTSRFYIIRIHRVKLLDEATFGEDTYVEAPICAD